MRDRFRLFWNRHFWRSPKMCKIITLHCWFPTPSFNLIVAYKLNRLFLCLNWSIIYLDRAIVWQELSRFVGFFLLSFQVLIINRSPEALIGCELNKSNYGSEIAVTQYSKLESLTSLVNQENVIFKYSLVTHKDETLNKSVNIFPSKMCAWKDRNYFLCENESD